MDVKSTFLYGTIDEEVYVSQPPGFVDPKFPKKVYKVAKALYGLHQAPKAWYATLSSFLLKSGYRRGTIDKTLFIKKDKNDIMLMSSMGELTFFLGLQVKQKEDGIFISQDKYVVEILKKIDFASVKTTSTPIETHKSLTKDKEAADVDFVLVLGSLGTSKDKEAADVDVHLYRSHLHVVNRIFRYLKGKTKLGLWYPRVSSFDLEAYSNSDYAGANLDMKSTTGGCQFLGRRLISWQFKKQTIVATSTTEVKYVDAANCCGQVLWIQNQMLDYGFNFMNTKIYIDNESTICIVKNLVFHSKTKHIEIRHHFIRDAYEKKLIQVLKIHTDDNVADLLTKAFDFVLPDKVGAAKHKVSAARQLVMLSDKEKLKGVEIKEKKDAKRPARSVLTLKPLPKIDPKDKGKRVLEEEPKPVKVKSKDQARLERQRQEQASLNYIANLYDEVQARIDVDHELAVRRTQEEQEKYIVDERAKLLVKYFENTKKQLAEERADAIRNKPLTKSQLRSLMMTYLKHIDFVPIGSEEDERLIQKMNKKVAGVHEEKVLEEPDNTKVEVKQEGNKESTRKRPGKRLKMKATKKSRMQKIDSDLEEEEHLKTFLKLVPDKEGIIDYEVLEKRFPIINWESKFYHLDRHGAECIYYRIFRSDESSRWIKTFSEMVKMFDRLDLEELYNLVMQRFESTTPEGVDLVLWGDLRTMFDANTEDELWQNQERWNLKSWNFYENCGVHTLTLEDGTEIHMLAERKYPLTKETLERMMSLKLIAESASESAYNLLRFIQKQIDEYGSYDGSEKDL
ncbi:putative ribonuclease H-like domain-containing protein [Tanacetum coccineum]